MNRLRETAWFDGGSRNRIWALLVAYGLVALTVVAGTSDRAATAATTPVQLANSWTTGLTHTVGAGSDRLLVYVVTIESAGGDVTNVTYGGQGMTEAVEDVYTSGDGNRVEIWYLDEAGIQAASGNSFVPTYSVGPDVDLHAAVTFANVDQSAPIVSTASTTGTSATLTTASFSVVMDGMAVSGTSHEGGGSYADGGWGSGWGEGVDQASGTTQGTGNTTSAYGASGTDTATATHSASGRHAIVAISLAPSGDPADATISGLVWRDTNEDAIAQAGENTYMVGATVNLYSPGPDTILGTPDDVLADTTTTSAVGTYSFASLAGGSYLVEVDETTLPPYWRFTGFANPATVSIAPSEARTGVDFGYRQKNTGSANKTPDPVGGVLPGQVLTYERVYDNTGDPPETGVGLENPLPAGTTFVPGSTTVEIIPRPLFYDRFAAHHYNNSNYTGTFAGPWEELGEATDPDSGDWQIALNGTNPGLRKGGAAGVSIQRLVTTDSFDEGFFFLNYQRENMPVGATLDMQISATGTAGPWTTIAQIDGTGGSDASYVALDRVDVSSYMTGNTAIRFVHTGTAMGAGEYLWLDWIGVRGVGAPIFSGAGAAPPTLTSGHTINSGQRLRVTFQVTVDDPTTETDIVSTPTLVRDGSPPWALGSNTNPVVAISTDAANIVINEANYAATPGLNANDEFIELHNAGASPVDISGWQLANGWSNVDHTFVASTTLGVGEYAVVWVGPGGSAPGASVEVWENKNPRLEEAGDSLWLWDAAGDVVDVVVWGTGSDTTPHSSLWDATYQASLAGAATAQSISLTPNGADGDASACWERTTSGDAGGRCAGYLPTADTNPGAAIWSVGAVNNAPVTVSGTIFQDNAGDGLADGPLGVGPNPFESGVRIEVFRDGGDNKPDGVDDVYEGFTVSALTDGTYAYGVASPGIYWVTVDSQGVFGGPLNAGFASTDTWAEQTYGPEGAAFFDGSSWTFAGSAGAHYGGAQADVSDNFVPTLSLPGAEHIARADLTAGSKAGVDFGFSFNAVTSVEPATAPGIAGRSDQGSLDQFIRNANAVAGPNAMRFVPAAAQNDGTGSWWRIDYAAALNPLQDIFDAGTVIDGTAFEASDGVSVVDTNGDFLGANAVGGVSVGTAPTLLPQVEKPELEIKDEGLRLSQTQAPLLPNNTEIRDLSIWGATTSIHALTGGSSLTGLVFDGNVIGTPPDAFVDPATVGPNYGLRVYRATGTQVTNNLIGFVNYTPVLLEAGTSGATVSGNEIRGGGRTQSAWDGLLLWGTGDTIDGNLIAENGAMGIDLNAAVGGHTIENNTVQNSGLLGVQTAGLRIKNHDNTVRFNVFQNNAGPGISVEGGAGAALRNLLSQNEYTTNGGLSIDLALLAGADNLGDGVNPNDATTNVTHGNEGLDHPVITAAATTSVSGTACANCTIEVYRAVAGAGDTSGGIDYGEGVEFLASTVSDAGGAWTTAVTGLVVDDEVSAIAIDVTNNTSEFGLNETVNAPPVLDAVGDTGGDELSLLSFTATATDPNPSDTLLFSLSGEPAGASITGGGVFSWTPTETQGPGDYSFDVVVTDDGVPNLADSESITVTVNEVNTAPSVTNPGNQTNDEGDVVFLAVVASDVDLPANVLTYSATGLPLGLTINEVTGAISGTVSYTAAGVHSVDVTVTDNGTPASLFTTVNFSWTINDIVIPGIPLGITKVSDGGGSVLVGETIEYTITVTNTDIEEQTNFTVSDVVPAGTTYVASSTTVDYPSSVVHTFRDEFNAQTYSETDGTEDWSTSPWVEIGEVDGPLAGAWQVTDDSPPAVGPFGLYKTGSKNTGIARLVDLDPVSYADASLSFKYRRNGMIPANTILVQVSTAGLAGPWTNLFIIDGGPGGLVDAAYVDSPVLDLRGYRSATTAIRFYHTGANDFDTGRFIMFDDIQVDAIERVPASAAGGSPPTLATGYDLYPGESITVTWEVTVDAPAGVPQVENTASVTTDQETTPASAGPVIDVVANRDPVAVDDGPGVGFSTTEDVASYTTGSVLSNDSDPDSDPITVDSFDATSTGGGTVSYNGAGTFDYIPVGDFNGNDTFTYTLDDGRSGSATATVTIAVAAVNDPPSFTSGGNVTVAEDSGAYSAGWASSISEGPADESWQTVGFNVTGNTNPGLFSVTPAVNAAGTLTFTPAGNANGSADITIEAQDNGGGDDTSPAVVFTITVTAENDPPVLDAVGDQSVDELTALAFTATASDPSDTPANLLTFSLVGEPAGATITAGGDFSWTPTEAQGPGSYTFDVVVTETNGSPTNLSDSESITVTVNEVNLPPILDAVGDQSTDELVNLSFTATATDPDDPANLLTFSLVGAPAGASITAGGVFSWTPTEAQGPGSYSFDVVVTETNGSPTNLNDSESITVTVNEVNLPPVLDAVGDQSVDELVNLSFTATASDVDDPANTLFFSLVGAPAGASIGAGGVFSWTPTEAQGPGSYTFDVVVTDDGVGFLSDSETITVTVGEVNLPPVLDAVGDQSIDELVNLSFTATASDPDDPANLLTFSLVGEPAGASITAGGVFSWTPTEAQGPGSYTFDVVVTETNGSPTNLSDSESITVTVNEVNLPPILDAVGDQSTDELVALSFTATASDPNDTPANLLTFSLSGEPAGATITAGGVFSWTPTEAQGPGSYSFDVVVTETNGSPTNLSDSESITVTVGEVNLPPVLGAVGDQSTDELVNLSFTATASDPDDPANLLTFSLSGEPAGASITAGGDFSWTPTEAQGPGSFTFDVVVTETNGSPTNLSDSETITVTVNEVNLPPILDAVGNQSTDELVNLSFTATATDPDDPANLLTFSLVGEPAGASITAGGDFSWTPTEAQGPGSYTFDVVVAETDGSPTNLSDSETITVTVNEVNVPPVLDGVGDQNTDELVALSFTATASDLDDPANTLFFSLVGAPAGASIGAGGVFSWTPTEAQGPGSYTFDVVVTDDGVGFLSDSETITVTVNEVNLPPILDAVGDQSVGEETVLSFTATASDPDDPANLLTFSLVGGPAGASITAGGVFSWTPTEAQGPGSYTFDVVVTETNGLPTNLSDPESITVTVTEGNLAPVLDAVGDQSIDELVNLSFTATATDPDTPANLLTFSLSGEPGGATITAGGVFSWTPTEAQGPGSYSFDVVVTETNGLPTNLSDSETITVTVGEVNLAPTLNAVGDQSVDELVNLSFTATASDLDDPANLLTFSLVGEPAGATITAGGDFNWTPSEAQGPGSFTFDVVVTETNGLPTNLSDSETITVTVGEVNLPPILDAVGDQSTDELVNLSFTATATDPDTPANLLTFSLVGEPAGASITAGGVFSWTPTEAQGPGSYSFDVVVTETNGLPTNLSDSESITVTVNEVNLAPVLDAVGDQSTDELVNLSFTATATDPDTPANLLTFSLVGEPAGASITAGGDFSWTPTEAQGPGSYTFDVVVTETDGSPTNLSDSETITVTVNEVNVPPILNAVGDQSVDELVALSFTATASDVDDPANTLFFSLVGAPAGASIGAGGVFTWTPTEAQGPGSYTFDVVVTDDGVGFLSDSETITVTVGEVNLPPVLDAVGDQSTDELTLLSFTATASDLDDPANLLTFSLVGEPAGATITAGGDFSWTPTEAQGPGSYTFDVVVAETNGLPTNLSDSESITVTVTEGNLAPVLDAVGDQSTDELTLLSFTATASDLDDPANLLTFSLVGEPAGATITAGGDFNWTPSEAQGPGSFTFDVVVTETNGLPTNLSDSETITVTVGEVNLPPILDAVGDQSTDELVNLSFTATATDPDTPANLLTFSLSGEPAGASITAGGVFSWTPTEAQGPGSYSFDVVVTETNGLPTNLSDSESITVTVNEVNLAPVLDAVGDQSTDELVNLSFTATATDPDTPANLLTFSLVGEPAGASITAGGDFSWTPTEAQGPGSYTFDVVVTETDGSPTNLSDSETITVTVNEVNVPPILNAVGDQSTDELVNLSFTATASDVDDPANLLTFSLVGEPAGASITAGGVFSWTPTEAQGPGSYTFDVVVTETNGLPTNLSDSESITVTVGEVNLPPVLDAVGDQSVDELTALSFTATASDLDTPANLLTFSLVGEPAGASITAGGDFSWTPTEAQGPGSYTFDVSVTDDGVGFLSDSETITVTVNEVNVPPTLNAVGDRSVDELTALSFTATASDVDDPANTLFFSLVGAPAGASIGAGGVFSWTPAEAQGPGSYTFDVVVTDDGVGFLSDSETITVTVNEVNVPPTLNAVGDQSTDELVALSFTATATDLDDPANLLVFSLSGEPVGASITAGGVFSWTPSEAQGPGSYSFDVVVAETDGSPTNLSDSESITVTVGEVNLPPILDAVGDQSTDELVNLSFTATASDLDDPANVLTFSLVGEPAGASITAGGDFSWTPSEAQGPGSYSFDVVVGETNGSPTNLSDSESITVTVGEVNLPPILDAVGDQSIDELVALSFTATGSDPDTPANVLVFSLVGEPVGASITPGGVFSWTPTEAQGPGSFTFDVVVAEINGLPTNLSDSESITVTVGEVNLAPVLGFVGNRATDELVALSFTATASDPDDPANVLTFSLVGEPAGASITAGGVFSWTPTEAQGPGSYSFDVVVAETNGLPVNLSDSESITVTVGEDNLAPVLDPVGDQSIDELVNLSFTATAADPDDPANVLTFSLVGEPAGASITAGGDFSWTPSEAQGPGSFTFDVVVTETNGLPINLSDSESITVTVNEVNLPPILDAVGDQSVDELVNLSFTATASDPDDPANVLVFSLSGEPVGASITAGGVFSWTPSEAQGPGSYSFDVVVAETNGSPVNLSDSETITVTVGEVNTAPSAALIGDVIMDEETLFSLLAVAADADLPAESLTWSLDSGPGTLLPTGYFIYTPTEADGPGVYPVTLRVTDSGAPALSDTVSFVITVAEVNVAPVVSPPTFMVAEGGVLSPGPEAGVLTGASDAEGNPISVYLDSPPEHGSLSLLADGSFTYTHDGSENFVDGFSFIATDGIDVTGPTTVTLTVDPVNDAPVLTGAVLTPGEDTAPGTELGSLTATDAEGDPVLFALTAPSPVFSVAPLTGVITLIAPLDYETVSTFTVTVSVTDPSGATDVVDVVINVTDVDEAPVAVPAAFPIVEDLLIGSTVGIVSASDPEGGAVSFAIVGGDPGGQFTIDPSSGELILVAPLDAAETPSYLLDVTASDPAGNTVTTAVIVAVTPAALLPSINAMPLGLSDLITLSEDTRAIVAPLINDTDADGDPLLVSWIDAPVNGTLTANGDGTYTYQPNLNFYGEETLSYGISDGRGGFDTSVVVLSIMAVNDVPVAPNVNTVLEFTPSVEIPIPAGVYDPDGDAIQIAVGTPDIGTVTLTDGVFVYTPLPEWNGTDTFTYQVTDGDGGLSTGLITVRVVQIDGDLVAIDLVTVEDVAPPPVPSSGIVVDTIKLLIGSVVEMGGLLGIPLLAVGIAFLGSILFGLSRNFLIGRGPVFLPATSPGNVAVVRVPTGGVLTALEGAGDEYPLVYRFGPAETGIRSTGRRAQRGSTRWIEVETPDGDAWVIDRFVTPTVPAGSFASDDQVTTALNTLQRVIAKRGDLTPLVSEHGLEIAYYASPKHFGGEDLASLLDGDASWGWWDPTGSTPSVRGEFSTIVADPLAESLNALEGRAIAEAVVEIPVELVNFPNLTFSEPDRLGWRVFYEYEDDEPKLAAIWREGIANPAAI